MAQYNKMSRLNLKVSHPEFRYVADKALGGYPVVVFERELYRNNPLANLKEYKHNKAIVEGHGGVMREDEYHFTHLKNEPFDKKDIGKMCKAVKDSLPDYKIRLTWNGIGLFSFSVSIMKKK